MCVGAASRRSTTSVLQLVCRTSGKLKKTTGSPAVSRDEGRKQTIARGGRGEVEQGWKAVPPPQLAFGVGAQRAGHAAPALEGSC